LENISQIKCAILSVLKRVSIVIKRSQPIGISNLTNSEKKLTFAKFTTVFRGFDVSLKY